MSISETTAPGTAAAPRRRIGWALYPLWFALIMLGVACVNGAMIYWALSTFPGEARQDGFDLSNRYDAVLAATKQQDALGWDIKAESRDGFVRVYLGHGGQALADAAVTASAERPLGDPMAQKLTFKPVGGGWYQADAPLAAFQWDVMLTLSEGGHNVHVTRRVVVPAK